MKLGMAIILCLIIDLFATIYLLLKLAVINPSSINLYYQGDDIQILYNPKGIPFIQATTDNAFFYGIGYAQASLRLWSMQLKKHFVSGTLSEIYGEKFIEADKFFRTLAFKNSSIQSLQSYP